MAEDLSRAARGKLEAAVRGDANAQAELGTMYATGDGVPQSDARALQWLLRAANQGHAEASLRLSDAFASGKGVAINYVQAYKWAFLAGLNARAGSRQVREDATRALESLAQRMSDADIASARSQASNWQPVREASRPVQPSASEEADGGTRREAAKPRPQSRKAKRRRAPSWRPRQPIRLPFP
jgi:hypothetical protein